MPSTVKIQYANVGYPYVGVPAVLHAGDTAKWLACVSGYSSDDGYSLEYKFCNQADELQVTSTADGNGGHLVDLTGVQTADLEGPYTWHAKVVGNGLNFVIQTGPMEVKPALGTGSCYDTRSEAKRQLDLVNAAIEGKLTKDVAEYQINGRSLKRYQIPDLIMLRDKLKREVDAENRAARFANGSNPNIVKVRL